MNSHQTLILGRDDIAGSMLMADYIDAVEEAFRKLAQERVSVPAVVHIPAEDGAFHVKSAAYTDGPAYVAVKVNANFPGNPQQHGLPTIQGVIALCDGRDGRLLALIDSIEVTAMRTGAATAVAARYLARPKARVATIIGCGVQGRVQLQALAAVLALETVYACDRNRSNREAFVEEMASAGEFDVQGVEDFTTVTRDSDVIATCTTSRQPFLYPQHVAAGTFIAAVGADNDDKQELAAELLANARVVVDIEQQCAEFGELHHALSKGTMQRGDVAASLADVIVGQQQFAPDDIVVFDSTGSAIQDVAAAGIIYERATAASRELAVALG